MALQAKCEVKSSVSVGTATRDLVGDVPPFAHDPGVCFGRVERLQRQLRTVGVNTTDEILVVVGLSRLPAEHEGLTTVLDALADLKCDKFKEHVRTYYRRKVSKRAGGKVPRDAALKADITCGYCGKSGHDEKKCFKKKRVAPVRCSLCGNEGHYSDQCDRANKGDKKVGPAGDSAKKSDHKEATSLAVVAPPPSLTTAGY